MSYKTILVHVDRSKHLYRRVEIAARLAALHDAHLIGVALSGLPEIIFDSMLLNPADPNVAQLLKLPRQRAAEALAKFEELARQFNVKSVEIRLEENENAHGITLQARYCDLVVLGQYDPDDAETTARSDFVETVILESGVPVLFVPYRGANTDTGRRVLISWNASKEAARAVHDALAMLRLADMVEVTVFAPETLPAGYRAVPDNDILDWLQRHGIGATVTRKTTSGDEDIASSLLSQALDAGANLLVMGCYGHSRTREILLGGVTRAILKSATMPVLMAH